MKEELQEVFEIMSVQESIKDDESFSRDSESFSSDSESFSSDSESDIEIEKKTTMSNHWVELINNHYGEAKLWVQIAFSFHQKLLKKIETLAIIYEENDKSIVDYKNELHDNIDNDKFKDLYIKSLGKKDSYA